jgi:hypothetical protein
LLSSKLWLKALNKSILRIDKSIRNSFVHKKNGEMTILFTQRWQNYHLVQENPQLRCNSK